MKWKARGEVFTRDGMFLVVRDDGGIDEVLYHANNHFLFLQRYHKCSSKEDAIAWLNASN